MTTTTDRRTTLSVTFLHCPEQGQDTRVTFPAVARIERTDNGLKIVREDGKDYFYRTSVIEDFRVSVASEPR